jgi:hypothetical protein
LDQSPENAVRAVNGWLW